MPAYKVARMGMVRTFQLTKVLSKLTVIENMRVGRHRPARREPARGDVRAAVARRRRPTTPRGPTTCSSASCSIKKREDFAGSLSGGQRKLLEMARALMADPELVMLDEPMAGVNPALKQSLLGHVKSLRDEGRTVLFVEHDMDMVRDISDWVIVMAQGKIVAEGPPDSVMTDQRVIDAYLGAHHDPDISEDDGGGDPRRGPGRDRGRARTTSRPTATEEETPWLRPRPPPSTAARTSRPPRAPCCAPTT